MRRSFLFICCMFSANFLFAQTITPEDYINTYKTIAIDEMKRSGIPASITLAQGLLETESGNSDLVKKSNNHFGIKCKSNWTGESVRHTDDALNECFRKYTSAKDSYKDHSDYLKNTPRYASLFELPVGDYKGWAYGLKKAGYATNPRYPQIVISNIEKHNLQQFDDGYVAVKVDSLSMLKVEEVVANNEKPVEITLPIVSYENEELVKAVKSKSKFNSLKAIFASKGTSLFAIANAADISLSKLMEYNDLNTDGILKENQIIYLEKKRKAGNRDFYTTTTNEKIAEIAQNTGIQLKILAELNGLNQGVIVKKGTKIKLR